MKEDFAIHGFQFLYDIHNNTTSYFSYYRVPELIQDLQHYLNINLIDAYRIETSRYCALCKVPFSAIADIDENDYIYDVLKFLLEYKRENFSENKIIRLKKDYSPFVDKWIPIVDD